MKKFFALLVLCIALVAFAAPAFARVSLVYHFTDDSRPICDLKWFEEIDDEWVDHRYEGEQSQCPYCTGRIKF